MRPVTGQHHPRDPAPSRLGYRLHRMWMTPLLRRAVVFGLPLVALAIVGQVVVTHTPLVTNVRATAAELKRMIEERPEFTVRLMAIDGATPNIAGDIRTIVPLHLPMTSFDLNLGAIRKKVEKLDAVESASVYIRSGGILQIDVVQRKAAVVWRGPKGLEMLDATGHEVAALAKREDRADLPLIVGENAEKHVRQALKLFADAGPLAPRIRGLQRVGDRRWDIVLDRHQRILLPEVDADLALERVLAMDKAYNLFARDVVLVDMRILTRPTIRSSQGTIDYLRKMSGLQVGSATR